MGLTTGRPWKINGVYPTKPCLVCNTLIDVKERARWDRTKFCSKACKYAYKKPVITILETDNVRSYMDSRKKHLLAKYGLSIEQYMDMHESQNGLCAICFCLIGCDHT